LFNVGLNAHLEVCIVFLLDSAVSLRVHSSSCPCWLYG
jgi:hypothetical protein